MLGKNYFSILTILLINFLGLTPLIFNLPRNFKAEFVFIFLMLVFAFVLLVGLSRSSSWAYSGFSFFFIVNIVHLIFLYFGIRATSVLFLTVLLFNLIGFLVMVRHVGRRDIEEPFEIGESFEFGNKTGAIKEELEGLDFEIPKTEVVKEEKQKKRTTRKRTARKPAKKKTTRKRSSKKK